MLDENEVRKIIQQKIEKEEYVIANKIGDYSIDEISAPKRIIIQEKECWELTYRYSVLVIAHGIDENDLGKTFEYQKSITIDGKGLIISETEKDLLIESS